MNTTFWSNSIWYVLLAITSVISMTFSLIKSNNRKFTIAFTLTTLGFVYLCEAILVIAFDSYRYYPKLTNDLFQDTVFGNMFSQISISTTSSLAIVYGLSYRWYFAFAIIYYFIEILFVKLGIYQHNWYRSIYTPIAFVSLFWFVKVWYNKLIYSSRYYLYYFTLFLAAFAVGANTIIMPLKLLNIQVFKGNFYSNPSKDHTTVAIIYGFFLINILINIYHWKIHWKWKGVLFVFLFIAQFTLYKLGFIYIKNLWFYTVTLIDLCGFYFYIILLDSYLRKGTITSRN